LAPCPQTSGFLEETGLGASLGFAPANFTVPEIVPAFSTVTSS
jgi:hypothetical protein